MRLRLKLLLLTLVAFILAWTQAASGMILGAHAPGPGQAWNVRGRIYEPSYFLNGTWSRAYWIYATFSDGTFFQAGVLDAGTEYSDLCQTGFSTFVTALNSNGESIFPNPYNNQHCNLTGAHYYMLGVVEASPPDTYTWRWSFGENPLGPELTLPFMLNSFDRQKAGAKTEIVKVGRIPANAELPSVRYNPAIQLITPNSTPNWINPSGVFYATYDRICRYALRVDNADNFVTGLDSVLNPTNCHSSGDSLW